MKEHHQTLAHLVVLFRYTTLLDKVAQWGIDVDEQVINGPLHPTARPYVETWIPFES